MIDTESNLKKFKEKIKNSEIDIWIGTGVSIALNDKIVSWKGLKEKLNLKLRELNVNLNEINEFEKEESEHLPTEIEKICNGLRKIYLSKNLREILIEPFYRKEIDKFGNSQIIFSKMNGNVLNGLYNLGANAKNIINFNYEPISGLVVCIGANKNIKLSQYSDIKNRTSVFDKLLINDEKEFINLYHPHGCLDIYGNLVLTKTDYENYYKTKYSQIPLEKSLSNIILIIGMSIGEGDFYLREYLQEMSKTKDIFWLNYNKYNINWKRDVSWAEENNIEIIDIEYEKFWNEIGKIEENIETEREIYEKLKSIIICIEEFHGNKIEERNLLPLEVKFPENFISNFYCEKKEVQNNIVLTGRKEINEFEKEVISEIESDKEKYITNGTFDKNKLFERYRKMATNVIFKRIIEIIELYY